MDAVRAFGLWYKEELQPDLIWWKLGLPAIHNPQISIPIPQPKKHHASLCMRGLTLNVIFMLTEDVQLDDSCSDLE